jgi:streptomycin 6-kinase
MTDPTPVLPQSLVEAAEGERRSDGLSTLPATIARLARPWSLTVDAPFQPGGQTAWVAPVRERDGAERVLKVGWAHATAVGR